MHWPRTVSIRREWPASCFSRLGCFPRELRFRCYSSFNVPPRALEIIAAEWGSDYNSMADLTWRDLLWYFRKVGLDLWCKIYMLVTVSIVGALFMT